MALNDVTITMALSVTITMALDDVIIAMALPVGLKSAALEADPLSYQVATGCLLVVLSYWLLCRAKTCEVAKGFGAAAC